jgi:hypothetical protein
MSTFGKHHLTATNGIVASIIGAVIKLPMSKVGNTWGRVELFVAVVLVTVFGRVWLEKNRRNLLTISRPPFGGSCEECDAVHGCAGKLPLDLGTFVIHVL